MMLLHMRASRADRAVTGCNRKGGITQGSGRLRHDPEPDHAPSVGCARLGAGGCATIEEPRARSRRFPRPWLVEETAKAFCIPDADGQVLASLFRG